MSVIEQESIYTGNPGDIVRAVNREDYSVRVAWDSRTHVLPPGTPAFIPWEAMMNYFGDPRATVSVRSQRDERGLRSFVADRPTEIRRIRSKWGFEMIDGETIPREEEYLADRGRKGDTVIKIKVPRVEFHSLEGQRIYTVVDDPAGDQITSSDTTVAQETTKDALILQQGKRIDTLMQMAQERGWLPAEPGEAPTTPPVPVEGSNGETKQLMADPPSESSSDSLPEDEH